jgi:hypothetical protein
LWASKLIEFYEYQAQQMAAQAEQGANEDVLTVLMEAEANGHTFMHPYQRLEETEKALMSITLEELNAVSRELCEHLSHMDIKNGVQPAAIVACAPVLDRTGAKFSISDSDVSAAIERGLSMFFYLSVFESYILILFLTYRGAH